MTTLGIGETARLLGTTPRALRYYEGLGLLTPAVLSSGGHRRYDSESLNQARRVLAIRALGLSLSDVRAVLDGDATTPSTTTILQSQADRLTDQITHLAALHGRVEAMLASMRLSLGRAAASAPLLDLLEDLAMSTALTSIYTGTGDDGSTDLAGGVRVEKKDPRLEVIGDLDELTCAIGLALAAPAPGHPTLLRQIQNDLFDVGARVATETPRPLDPASYTTRIEDAGRRINARLQPTASFVLPGGSPYTAAVHLARAICRRAERHAWALVGLDREICRYLNRLSDLLFILARSAEPTTEPTWAPAASTAP